MVGSFLLYLPLLMSSSAPRESLLGSLLRFLARPDWSPPLSNQSLHQIGIALLRLYALQLSLILLLSALLNPIQSYFLSSEGHALSELAEAPIGQFILFSVVMAPVVEELIFRLPLRLSVFNLSLSCGLLGLILLGPGSWVGTLLLGALVGLGGVRILGRSRGWDWSSTSWLDSHGFTGIFYGSALVFGIVHLSNYLGLEGPWFLAPLLVVPQCVIGVFLGFIRLRYGFVWAIVSHSFHNLILTLPLMVTQLGSEALRQQMLDGGETEAIELTGTDQLIMTTIGLASLGTVFLCARTAYQMIQEWLNERQMAPLPKSDP